jgi:CubicO group peptidase (beta-lactamase class C family)
MALKVRTLIIFALMLMLVVSHSTVAGKLATAQQSTNLQAIDAYLESKRQQFQIPGLAIAIVQGDQIIHVKGLGTADAEKRSVTPETPFILGSVSKSFTALAILQLVDAGKMDLDAPVQQYLPWFRVAERQASSQITIRHLLNQVSGISSWTGVAQLNDIDASEEAIEKHVRNLKSARLSQPVGKKFQYSNSNYTILGMVVQTVAGMPYEQYVQQHIFTPLEMEHSYTSQVEAQKAIPALSVGNRFWFGYPVWTEVPYNRGDLPAGYLISSVENLAHYLIAQMNDGRYKDVTLVSGGKISELHQPAVDTGGGQSYGMGWFTRNINSIPIVYHAGAVANYSTNMTLIPDKKLGFALLTNVYPGVTKESIPQLYKGIINLLVGRPPVEPRNNLLSVIQVIALPILLILQLLGLFRAWAVVRRWHTHSKRPYLSVKSLLRHIGLPLIVDGAIAAGLLIGLPILFVAPLPIMLCFQPDLISIAVLCATLALAGGLLRTGISLRVLSKTSP